MKLRLLFLFFVLFACSPLISQQLEEYKPDAPRESETVHYQLPLTDEPSVITIEKIDGHAILEGDIVLYEVGGLEDPDVAVERDAGAPTAFGTQHDYRWAKGEIPYLIQDGHPKNSLILQAIQTINDKTVLNIRPKQDSDTDYLYIKYVRGGGCWAVLGRRGTGRQEMSLDHWASVGNIIHEFLHVAGVYHEQSRSDRDQYVSINFSKIERGKAGNFGERTTMSVCDYDFGSIMHYPSTAFSVSADPTIVPKNPLPRGVVMGQRDGLSDCDIKGILNLYKTISPKAKQYEPYWFGDYWSLFSFREQGNAYNTGKDWDFKARSEPYDKTLPEWKKQGFQRQKNVLNDFKLSEFSFDNCKIKIKGQSAKSYSFDIRYGKAANYSQWYMAQYGSRSQSSTSGGYELNFETNLSECVNNPNETYFVALVVRYIADNGVTTEVPVAIRYYRPK